MAHCEIVRLSKKEARFIFIACNLGGAVYDFDNTTNKQFRENYGLQKSDAEKMLAVLQSKMDHIISKLTQQ